MKSNNIEVGQMLDSSKNKTRVAGAGVLEGDAVTLNGVIANRGPANSPLYGKCVKIEGDGKCTIITKSEITVKVTGALALGLQKLAVDGAGNVVVNAAGRDWYVLASTATEAAIEAV